MTIDEVVGLSKASIEKEDLRILLQIVSSIQPKHIVEVGTWKGYSAQVWMNAFRPDSFVTLEIEAKHPDAIITDGVQYFWECDSHYCHFSDKESIDFLFLDGDHAYEGVKKDWEIFSPLVRKGGIVAFHDVVYTAKDPDVQVKPLWDELKTQYPYVEIKVGKNSTGMGVLFI